jgi:hypothetical protein
MSKLNSIISKGKTILKEGFEPVEEGVFHYHNINEDVEAIARERIETCIGCPFFKKEPVDFLRVKDERIIEASEMYCEDCGCTLPYKIRQTIKTCDKWLKE